MRLLYFAWLKQKTGVTEEEVELPGEVTKVSELLDWLAGRGEGYAEALANRKTIRVAVNQEYARADHPVQNGDEVALFPPVTGG